MLCAVYIYYQKWITFKYAIHFLITVSNLQNNVAGSASAEAVEALVSLGYSQADAALVVGSLDSSMSVDEMIRHGLKELAKNL